MNELNSVVVKDGYFLRNCGDGVCLSQRQDGVLVDIAYKSTLDNLLAYVKSWNCGIV